MGRRIGLVMAMEEEMLQAEEQTTELDNEGSAETAMLEATDMDTEVEGQMDEIETVADSSDELSNIADVMEKSAENGGMDEQTAEVVEVAVEGIYARMGVKRHAKMPAMESFSNKASKLQATRIAIEGVKSFVAAAWKKIIEAIQSATAFIMDLVKKVFDANYRMKERAAAYATKLSKMNGKIAKEQEISAGSFGKALSLSSDGNKLAAEIATGLDRVTAQIVKATELSKKVVENLKLPTNKDNSKLAIELNMGTKVGTAEGFAETATGVTTTRSEILPGGQAFISTYPTTESTDTLYSTAISVTRGEFNPKAPFKFAAEKVKTGSESELKAIVAEVTKLSTAVAANKAECDKLYNARKEMLAKAKEMFSKASEETSELAKRQQDFARMFNKLSKEFMSSFSKFGVSTGLQALNYVQKSMEQYDMKTEGSTQGLGNNGKPQESSERGLVVKE